MKNIKTNIIPWAFKRDTDDKRVITTSFLFSLIIYTMFIWDLISLIRIIIGNPLLYEAKNIQYNIFLDVYGIIGALVFTYYSIGNVKYYGSRMLNDYKASKKCLKD